MFAVRAGETVITVESRAGTEEEIVVVLEVQHPMIAATEGIAIGDGGSPLFR